MTDLEKKWRAIVKRYGKNTPMYSLCWYLHCRMWGISESNYSDGPDSTKIHFARRFSDEIHNNRPL